MKKSWRVAAAALMLVSCPAVMAEELGEETKAQMAMEAQQKAADAVSVTPTGEQLVTVNSGNQVVDAAANLAAKCTERMGAMKACDSMGAFKAMACRKAAEFRYKGVECPMQ